MVKNNHPVINEIMLTNQVARVKQRALNCCCFFGCTIPNLLCFCVWHSIFFCALKVVLELEFLVLGLILELFQIAPTNLCKKTTLFHRCYWIILHSARICAHATSEMVVQDILKPKPKISRLAPSAPSRKRSCMLLLHTKV